MSTKMKSVQMAVQDKANATRFVTEMKDIEVVRVKIKNCDPAINGHVFNDVVSGAVWFATGETKTLEISEPEARHIREHRDGAWTIVP